MIAPQSHGHLETKKPVLCPWLTGKAVWPDMCPSGQITDGTLTDFTYEIAGVRPCYITVLQEL